MKRLLIAIAAAATTMFASARVLTQAAFEETLDGGFTGGGGTVTQYNNDGPDGNADYPFSGFGNYYCAIDADSDSPLTNSVSGTVFDMFVQFKAVDGAEVPSDAKIAIYLNSEGHLVVVGDKAYDCGSPVAADSWARLTIAQVSGGYKVYVDGTSVGVFTAETGATTVAFTGTGKLDNFVARTTDPFNQPESYVASVGGEDGERYATFADALADAAADSVIELNGNVDGTFALPAAGAKIKLNDHTFSGFSSVAGDQLLVVVASTADGVTTYSSAYFPRTATAGQDGSAEHPYEIADVDDLKALQAAVAAGKGADKCYVQTADIALDAAWPGIGVQNGKDLVCYETTGDKAITLEEASQRDEKWNAGAFKGIYDGGNHTISGFQMIGKGDNAEGLDYCGFFNSVDGATIKNLKIAYAGSLFATDTTASTKESGATFVGVAKNSTLQNLTSLEGTVSCSKGFGGIVGYLMGTTVDSCTNNLNMASLAKNKCGGIAMICQKADCSISNCKNTGTMTTGSGEFGGIIGYTDTITISDCENTAACKMFHHHGGTVTLSGTNKGNATVASYTGAATPGLNFATVSGNVATFVADNALALNGAYKVMASGATATYEFGAAGTIEFDTTLYTPTYAVTSDESKIASLDSTTVDNVTTYTAVAGVASVGGQAYATMQDAFDAVTAENNTVTMLANSTDTVTLDPAETVTITLVYGTHAWASPSPLACANGIVETHTDNGDGTMSISVVNNKASTWTGTAGDELWATASNWSTGVVPGQYTTVTFNDAGRVRIASDYDVVSVAGMVVNAAVTFSETNIDYSKYPAVKICGGNVTGTGKLTLERCGINGNNGAVTVDCDLAFANDTVAGGNIKDSFIQNGPFTINGDVTGTGYLKVMTGTTFNGDVTLGGNAYAMLSVQAAGTVFNGAVTLGDNGYIEMQTSNHAFGEEATLSGTGRIVCYTVAPSATLRPKLTDANGNWEGTLELKGRNANQLQKYSGDALKPDNFGNANSTVCYNGVTGYYAYGTYGNAYTVSTVKCVEIGELGLSIKYDADTDLYSDRQYVFASALKGSGTMSFATKTGDKYTKYVFTGDADEFTGSINFGALETSQPGVIFKTPTETLPVQTAYGQVIVAAGRVGENVVAAGGTWNAPGGIVVHGDVNVGATAALSMVYGDGKLVYAAKPTTPPTFDSTWAGTCVIGWTHGSNALNLNDYGNANSTVKIAADVTGGYIGNGGSTEADKTYTIAPAIELAANVTLTSGWGTGTKNGYLTTFPMLKGGNDKTLTLWGTGYTTYKTYYKFTALDGFGGTIAINNRAYATIETIKVAQTPAVGAKVANITIAEGGTLEDPSLITVKVGDEVQDVTLEFKADGAEGSGLYVAQPPAAKVAEVVNGEQYETLAEALADATDGATVKLLADVNVVSTGLTFPAEKAITFDLNGKTLTAGNGATSHVQVNGVVTITDSSEGAEGQIVSGENGTYGLVQVAENNTQEGAALTIAGGTIEAYFPDTLNSDQQHPAYGVTVKGKGTVFNMTGGKVKAGLMAVMGHGSKASAGTYTISGGTIESVDDFAMYLPTKSGCSVAISGGTFIGKGGVCVRAGTLNVTGGTFTASGTGIAPGASSGTTGASFAGLSVWPNYGEIAVTVSGGSFTSATGVDAVVLTASSNAATVSLTGGTYSSDPSVYVADGYAATESAGVWTVAEVQEIPVTPGAQTESVDTTEEAQAIAEKTVIEVPEAVAAKLTSEQATAYKALFEAKVVPVTVGETTKYAVEVVMKADAEAGIQAAVDAEAEDLAKAAVKAAADAVAGGEAAVTTTPGLYYVVEAGSELNGIEPASCTLATSTETKLNIPNKGTKGFYKISVSVTPVVVQE